MYSVRVVSPSCELHAVGRHDVTLRHRLPIRVGCRALEQIPVVRRQDDAGAELVLQVLCAARVVAVSVADDRVLDLRRIETEFLHAADDLVLDRVVEDRVDDDNSLGSRDGPRGVLGLSKEIEVVEHLRGFGMP